MDIDFKLLWLNMQEDLKLHTYTNEYSDWEDRSLAKAYTKVLKYMESALDTAIRKDNN